MEIELPTDTVIVSSQYNVPSPGICPGEEINQSQTTACIPHLRKGNSSPSVCSDMENSPDICPGEEKNSSKTTAGISPLCQGNSSPSVCGNMENSPDNTPTTLAELGESTSSFNLDKCDNFMDEVKLFFFKCKYLEKNYSFQAVTSAETTKDSEAEEENPLASFSMELYWKSSNFRPNPERLATVGKTLKLSASKGPAFYKSRFSYYRYLFNHVYNLTAKAQRLKLDILHISHLTPPVLKFVPIEKDDLLYLHGQLEAILGENYFDASDRSDMESTTDRESEIPNNESNGSLVDIEVETTLCNDGQSTDLNPVSPVNLSGKNGLKHSPSPLEMPSSKKFAGSCTETWVKTTCIVTCSSSTTSSSASQTSTPTLPTGDRIQHSETWCAVAEFPTFPLPLLHSPMKPCQEFIPRKETDKLWVMGYYVTWSNGHVIEVEFQSKEAKEKYE